MSRTPEPFGKSDSGVFTHRVLIATGIAVASALPIVLAWYARDLLLLVFAGILRTLEAADRPDGPACDGSSSGAAKNSANTPPIQSMIFSSLLNPRIPTE